MESRGPEFLLDGTFNDLNQLTSRGWSGKLPLYGNVDATNAAVLVQGYTNAPPFYQGTNWLGGATVTAGSNNIPVVAWIGTNGTEANRIVFLPPSNPQPFSYDRNGNLLSDGYRNYTWNDENRLVAIRTVATMAGWRGSDPNTSTTARVAA